MTCMRGGLPQGIPALSLVTLLISAMLAGCASAPASHAGNASPPSETGLADGRILQVDAEFHEVTISLTNTDRLRPGMHFLCFNPRLTDTAVHHEFTSLAADADLALGQIEVIQTGDHSSLCRITAIRKNHPLQAGDVIFNPLYHLNRHKTFHFVVTGDFDLDGDGIATPTERELLEHMIQAWGGQIDPSVTPKTDYLLAGARPASPSLPFASPPQLQSAVAQRLQSQNQYDSLIGNAHEFAIPVLNKNRFFDLINFPDNPLARR